MKYFLDTEFIEGTQCTLFGHTKPTIDLISIGIIAEDGREYYAISKDFNLKEAWNRYQYTSFGNNHKVKEYWIRDNVLLPIYLDKIHGDMRNHVPFSYSTMKGILKGFGKTNKQIAEEIYEFCSNDYHKGNNLTFSQRKEYPLYDKFKPEFYGYYSDYDWVAFCWLFGRMIDLPEGFPMFAFDLKQSINGIVNKMNSNWFEVEQENIFGIDNYKRIENPSFDDKLKLIEQFKDYPKQTNEHNALSDAKWNKQLYEFLNKL